MKTILLSILMGCLVLGVYAETPRTPLTISLEDLDQLYLTNRNALLNTDITVTKVAITTKALSQSGYILYLVAEGSTQVSIIGFRDVDGKKLANFAKVINTPKVKTISHVRIDTGWFGEVHSSTLFPLEGFSITIDEAPVSDEKSASGSVDPKQGS